VIIGDVTSKPLLDASTRIDAGTSPGACPVVDRHDVVGG
jgi:hypothetical protein